jgi:tetratricopeptide (TPR) repeat protein
MSLFDAIKKKSALKNGISQVTAARAASDEKADALFSSAYQNFEAAIHKDLMISEALYNWGFALLHHAKNKSGDVAVGLYQDAITKFSFCLTIDPDYLGAAIDGGVALMDLARLQQVSADHNLYASAKRSFEKANRIQKGSASYNLACLYSLCHDEEACLSALQEAKQHGILPNVDDILADPDLLNVANKAWFIDFVEALMVIEPQLALEGTVNTSSEAVATETKVAEAVSTETQPENAAPDSEAETVADDKSESSDNFKSTESYEQK